MTIENRHIQIVSRRASLVVIAVGAASRLINNLSRVNDVGIKNASKNFG